MFIIDIHYTVPLEKIEECMQEHMVFLQEHYKKGTFLTSGRKVPRTGGIILASGVSKAELEKIMSEDPFVKRGVCEISITEFQTSQVHPRLKGMLK